MAVEGPKKVVVGMRRKAKNITAVVAPPVPKKKIYTKNLRKFSKKSPLETITE